MNRPSLLNLKKVVTKIFSTLLTLVFVSNVVLPSAVLAQSSVGLDLPKPGAMVSLSQPYSPVLLRGMTINENNPLKFDFIADAGDSRLNNEAFKVETEKLIHYFLASLTVPKNDFWVNLSPYEKDRIVPDALGKTELGRDMLAQDYILKQLTASLMYPDNETGKNFWNKVRALAKEKYGITEVPMETFNKVWIMPANVTIFEKGQSVYITETKLKVMLDEDFMSMKAQEATAGNITTPDSKQYPPYMKEMIREVIIPALEKEVNTGKNFAPLRQIFYSLILAKWYKEVMQDSIMNQVFIDKNKTAGIELSDPKAKEKIYDRYVEAFKQGVYNYIKEEYSDQAQEIIPRKYFSGGIIDANVAFQKEDEAQLARTNLGPQRAVSFEVKPVRNVVDNAALGRKTNEYVSSMLKAQTLTKVYINDVYVVNKEEADFKDVKFENGDIYLNEEFLRNIKGDKGEVVTRKMIHAMTPGSSREKLKAEYNYLKEEKPETLNNVLPRANTSFDDLFVYVRMNLAAYNNSLMAVEEARKYFGLGENYVVVEPNDESKAHAKELLETAEEALYKIAINVADGKVDLRKKVRLSSKDPELTEKQKSERVRAAMFPFAANPMTSGHYLVAMLKAMAESEADVYFATITYGDFRKPDLKFSYPTRLDLTQKFLDRVTGGLVRVMPALDSEMSTGQGLNGEEKVLPVIDFNKELKDFEFYYASGGDHYLSFYREKTGKVKFAKIIAEGKDKNIEDFRYYVRLPGYKELLSKLLDVDATENVIADEHKAIIRQLVDGDPEKLLEAGAQFPVLDVFGKLFLISKNSGNAVKLGSITTTRGAASKDTLRDGLGIPVVMNEGASFDISSTKIRNGIKKLVQDQILDLNEFEAIPVELLKEIIKPENRAYLYSLIQVAKQELSNAAAVLMPINPASEKNRRRILKAELEEAIRIQNKQYAVSESVSAGRSTIRVTNTGTQAPVLVYEYVVINQLDSGGHVKNVIKEANISPVDAAQTQEEADIESSIKEYVKKLNQAVYVDGALLANKGDEAVSFSSDSTDDLGGIDFNEINFTRQGEGARVRFNEDALRPLLNFDIRGFVPGPIDVKPIKNILPILGLQEKGSKPEYTVSQLN